MMLPAKWPFYDLALSQLSDLGWMPIDNDWEADFINSVKEQLEEKGCLSDAQLQKLSEIWHRHC